MAAPAGERQYHPSFLPPAIDNDGKAAPGAGGGPVGDAGGGGAGGSGLRVAASTAAPSGGAPVPLTALQKLRPAQPDAEEERARPRRRQQQQQQQPQLGGAPQQQQAQASPVAQPHQPHHRHHHHEQQQQHQQQRQQQQQGHEPRLNGTAAAGAPSANGAGGLAAAAAAAAASPSPPPSPPPALLSEKGKGGQLGRREIYSIHGEEAARRRAVAELIFFAGVNDLRRCREIAATWGIDVTSKSCMDYDKRTPLHISAAEGAFSVAQWLLDCGADPDPRDRHGRTPLEEAVRNDHAEVVRLLQTHRARVVEDGQLVPLELSRLKGLVNTRSEVMADIGWDPEWEVNPKELKLIQRIGSGEFGEVYKAKWHGSFVAAKVLRRSDEIALGDFRTEIAILRKIQHPNCVQFLGACTKQRPYIVLTELMACSLADAFASTIYAPTPRRQVEIALDFARGMAYLHSRRQPIVHRDLKPANLMISGNLHADAEQLYLDSGVIKVADFGLSKSLVPVDRHGSINAMNVNQVYRLTGETGSYRYMAPEVFRHEPYNLAVDVYSYGMIIYQLFETLMPFAGHDPVDAARQAAMLGDRPAFAPRRQLTPLTEELRRIVSDCWAADPDARPTFEQVVTRLESLLTCMPKHASYQPGGPGCCPVQ